MNHSFSNRLFLVPLFQGFSRLDFLDIVGKTRFDFHTLPNRATVVRQGDECLELTIILGGQCRTVYHEPSGLFTLEEMEEAPLVVQPERLFGLRNSYTQTFEAVGTVQTVTLSKQSLLNLFAQHTAMQINFANMVCTSAQLSDQWAKAAFPRTPAARLALFMQTHCRRPAGHKVLRAKMVDLAAYLSMRRLVLSDLLVRLKQREVITYSRGIMQVPSCAALLAALMEIDREQGEKE